MQLFSLIKYKLYFALQSVNDDNNNETRFSCLKQHKTYRGVSHSHIIHSPYSIDPAAVGESSSGGLWGRTESE